MLARAGEVAPRLDALIALARARLDDEVAEVGSPATVLLVDDSRAMRRIQRDVVLELGAVRVLEAGDGREAIEALAAVDFAVDLVLLDWVMPRMDGIAFARPIMRTSASTPP